MITPDKLTPTATQAAIMFGPEGINREAWQPAAAVVLMSDRDKIGLVVPEQGKGAGLPMTETLPMPDAASERGLVRHVAGFLGSLIQGVGANPILDRHVLRITGILGTDETIFTQALNDPVRPLQMLVPFAVMLRGQPHLKRGAWHTLRESIRQLRDPVPARVVAFQGILQHLVDYPSSCRR